MAQIDKPNYFNIVTYTGNGSTLLMMKVGNMQPDWCWIKNTSATQFINV